MLLFVFLLYCNGFSDGTGVQNRAFDAYYFT